MTELARLEEGWGRRFGCELAQGMMAHAGGQRFGSEAGRNGFWRRPRTRARLRTFAQHLVGNGKLDGGSVVRRWGWARRVWRRVRARPSCGLWCSAWSETASRTAFRRWGWVRRLWRRAPRAARLQTFCARLVRQRQAARRFGGGLWTPKGRGCWQVARLRRWIGLPRSAIGARGHWGPQPSPRYP